MTMTPDTKPLALRVADSAEFLAAEAERAGRELLTLALTPDEARALAALLREAGGWRPIDAEAKNAE